MDVLALCTKRKKNINDNRSYFNKVAHSNPSSSGFPPLQSVVPFIYSFIPQICFRSLLDARPCAIPWEYCGRQILKNPVPTFNGPKVWKGDPYEQLQGSTKSATGGAV